VRGVSAGKVILACVHAVVLSGALTACTGYKGQAYFDPFGVVERSGGQPVESGTQYEDAYLYRQGQRAREQAQRPAPPQTQSSDLFSGIARGELVFDTTDGTTDPGPGEWVRHGSVPGQELKKRKVDANVTLDEKRSTNDGNGSRQ